jgi:hypothetical protein
MLLFATPPTKTNENLRHFVPLLDEGILDECSKSTLRVFAFCGDLFKNKLHVRLDAVCADVEVLLIECFCM